MSRQFYGAIDVGSSICEMSDGYASIKRARSG